MENKPQSKRAHELAEFVVSYLKAERNTFYDHLVSRYGTLPYGLMFNRFADEIESLGEQDGLPYPLDKDGVPIKLGETVYRADGKRPFEYQIFNNCEYGMTVETISLHRDYIEITCDYYGCPVYYEPKQLTHFKPRTLDDILQDAESSVYYGKDTGNTVDELIKEAYDLGLSDGAKKDE